MLLRQVVERADQFADVHNMLGVIAHGAGQFAQAEASFARAVEINPTYTEAQLNLMVTLNDLGKYEASRAVRRGMRGAASGQVKDPLALGKIANMHADISQAYQDTGMQAEAIAELQKAVGLCSEFADLRTRLGVLYRDTGESARAQEQFEAALEANPGYVQCAGLPCSGSVRFDSLGIIRAQFNW